MAFSFFIKEEFNLITTEQALDMLPFAADLIEKLDIINKGTEFANNKDKSTTIVGMELVLYIIRNISKVRKEMLNIVAIAENKTAEEVSEQGIGDTISTFKKILENSDLMGFFKKAMQ